MNKYVFRGFDILTYVELSKQFLFEKSSRKIQRFRNNQLCPTENDEKNSERIDYADRGKISFNLTYYPVVYGGRDFRHGAKLAERG